MNTRHIGIIAALAALGLAACSDNDDPVTAPSLPAPPVQTLAQLPQLSPAVGATLVACADLATRISYPDTTITAANSIAAGSLA
ncbi:MAG: esterase, partial [Massilia sp.]|nr:esterase [Massilia sp.]